MKYKLIAADVDGTLLNSSRQLSDGNYEAIKKAMDKGIYFSVVSGRSVPALRNLWFTKELNTPVVAYNGAAIYDIAADKLLYYEGLTYEDALRILNFGLDRKTVLCVWSGDRYYTNEINERSLDYMRLSGMEPTLIEDYDALAKQGITKIIWYDDPAIVQKYICEMNGEHFDSVSYCTSNPAFLEFFSSKVSKAKALKKLAELLKISINETIAVGDGENDLPMLEYAGLGVAMENASDYVKSKCGYVTDSNDNDGVAKLIEKFCLD